MTTGDFVGAELKLTVGFKLGDFEGEDDGLAVGLKLGDLEGWMYVMIKSVIGECKMLLIKIKMSWNPYRSCWT